MYILDNYDVLDQQYANENELEDKQEKLHRLRKRNNMNYLLFELQLNEESTKMEDI